MNFGKNLQHDFPKIHPFWKGEASLRLETRHIERGDKIWKLNWILCPGGDEVEPPVEPACKRGHPRGHRHNQRTPQPGQTYSVSFINWCIDYDLYVCIIVGGEGGGLQVCIFPLPQRGAFSFLSSSPGAPQHGWIVGWGNFVSLFFKLFLKEHTASGRRTARVWQKVKLYWWFPQGGICFGIFTICK